MPQLQAQIVHHGVRDPEAMMIADAAEVYGCIQELNLVPLAAAVERRNLLEARCIEVEVYGKGEPPDIDNPDSDDFRALCPKYDIDPSRPEIFVDPMDFAKVGAICVAHRHILVTPVEDMSDFEAMFDGDDGE